MILTILLKLKQIESERETWKNLAELTEISKITTKLKLPI